MMFTTNGTLADRSLDVQAEAPMKKLLSIFVAALVCGTAISHAEDRDGARTAVVHMAGTQRGEGEHRGDRDRGQRHRPTVLIVGVPIFVGPAYAPYYAVAPDYLYQTIDGFYYFCADPAGYYPVVQECANGWRLVP
jgi:hypothetical protein